MRLPTVKDSRGQDSQTLFFTAVAASALIAHFCVGMYNDWQSVKVTEFATSFMMIMAPWIAREAVIKVTEK